VFQEIIVLSRLITIFAEVAHTTAFSSMVAVQQIRAHPADFFPKGGDKMHLWILIDHQGQ